MFSHESQTKAEAIAGLCFHGEGLSQAASIGAEQYFWRASALLGILRTTCQQLNHILARGQPSLMLYPQELQGMEQKPKASSNIFRITVLHQNSKAAWPTSRLSLHCSISPSSLNPLWPSWMSAGPSLSPSLPLWSMHIDEHTDALRVAVLLLETKPADRCWDCCGTWFKCTAVTCSRFDISP